MMCMPYMSTANPQSTPPIVFCFCFFENIASTAPITAITGVNEVGLSSWTIKEVPCSPVKLRIHAVAVVPMFAPMMMPTAWLSVMIPPLTKPTVITVVAEEL